MNRIEHRARAIKMGVSPAIYDAMNGSTYDFAREIAKMAARNIWMRQGTATPEELLQESWLTDDWSIHCSETEMINLLASEYARVRGQSLGGFISAARRKSKSQK